MCVCAQFVDVYCGLQTKSSTALNQSKAALGTASERAREWEQYKWEWQATQGGTATGTEAQGKDKCNCNRQGATGEGRGADAEQLRAAATHCDKFMCS